MYRLVLKLVDVFFLKIVVSSIELVLLKRYFRPVLLIDATGGQDLVWIDGVLACMTIPGKLFWVPVHCKMLDEDLKLGIIEIHIGYNDERMCL
jgi:hypothetical protein